MGKLKDAVLSKRAAKMATLPPIEQYPEPPDTGPGYRITPKPGTERPPAVDTPAEAKAPETANTEQRRAVPPRLPAGAPPFGGRWRNLFTGLSKADVMYRKWEKSEKKALEQSPTPQ